MDASAAWWIVGLYAVGAASPTLGLLLAYQRITRVVTGNTATRSRRAAALDWRESEVERLGSKLTPGLVRDELQREFNRRYLGPGETAATYRSEDVNRGLPVEGDLGVALHAARWDFLWVGLGLASATAASIWATLASIG